MAIQFGYIVMFAAAAPWAATLCLLNNAVERKVAVLAMPLLAMLAQSDGR